VTFKLSFSVDPQGVARAFAAFLRHGPTVAAKHKGAFDYWHASLHRDLVRKTRNELWFQFRVPQGSAVQLRQRFELDLAGTAGGLGFISLATVVQDEVKAFARVIAQTGGTASMDALWPQVQTATEWAIADLLIGTERQTPAKWHPWTRHIYRNLLGLE